MNFLYILLAIFIFGLLIFIHELGHFIVARLCGVKVLEFAIGMGPKLVSWKAKKSGTRYSLRLFPIGGYVSMLGENGMEVVQGSAEEEQISDALAEETDSEPDSQKDTFFFAITEKDRGDTDSEKISVPVSEEEAKHAYCNQSVWKRMLISIAGPFMNVFLGFVLMLVIVISAGQNNLGTTKVTDFYIVYSAEESALGMKKGDYLYRVDGVRIHSYTQLCEVVAQKDTDSFEVEMLRLNEAGDALVIHPFSNVQLNESILSEQFVSSVSEQSGLCVGDEIVKVNNVKVHTYYELAYEIMEQGYQAVDLTVLRNNQTLTLSAVQFPNMVESGVKIGEVDFSIELEDDFGIGTILKHTWFRSVSMVKMVYDSIEGLFSGRYGVEAVSGPVGITKTITDVAKTGFLNVLSLVTIISINLGVMNLLPLPALDGGHLIMYVIEAIRRKPVKQEVEGIINFVGLVLLLTLAVIIAIKDIIAL